MMKKLLLSIILLFAFNINAQISTLVQENWQTTKVTVDGTDYFPNPSNVYGYLDFEETMNMGICDYTVFGEITSIDNSIIYISNAGATLAVPICAYPPFVDHYPDNIILTQDLLNGIPVELEYQITYINNNEYQLVITNKNGDYATFNNNTLSDNTVFRESIRIYPNPVHSSFQIKTDAAITSITLFNLNGKKVKSFTSPQQVYHLENLPSGIYFARINTSEGNLTQKLIKE